MPMKPKDIRQLSDDEMRGKLKDLRQELFDLRFKHATNQLENTQRMKVVKRNIARLETVLGENARNAQGAEA